IRPLPFDRVQAGEGHDDTPRIGIMKSAPQCGPGKSRSTTVRNDTLLCICKSSKQTATYWAVCGGRATLLGNEVGAKRKPQWGRNCPSGRMLSVQVSGPGGIIGIPLPNILD